VKFARLSLSIIAAVAAAGCAHSLPMAPSTAVRVSGLPTAMEHGHKRAFGYNVARFQKDLKFKQHPVHMTHRDPLPAQVDNRQFCSPIADQGNLGSCTAFAMGKGLREYLQNKNGEKQVAISPLWLYYNERAHMGSQYINEDSGANMLDGQWVLTEKGNATETSWPYDISKFTKKPPSKADKTAAAEKITHTTNLANLDDVKTAIAAGQPVTFGFVVYESFMNIGTDGVMPMPADGERILGGHAVLAVSYDDEKKLLTVRNSWGTGWGDAGYFYMPYDFAANANNVMDYWTADK